MTSQERRAYVAALRASDVPSLESLARALRSERGCIRATARALGIPEQTLWSVARDVPAVRRVLAEGGIGRAGVARYRRNRTK
jgi:hypothetical protein